ncbi:MAG: gamma-glutamylcyclotransferase family protein [Beijerinckiaceae bacterium]
MPLYFAYGSNMDEAAMRARCPKSRAVGLARLARHRFALMADGYATVVRDPNAQVQGLLYDLALSDIPALDRYEDVARGLYVKANQPVLRAEGSPARALVYIGRAPAVENPKLRPGYMESVIRAARVAQLPEAYVDFLLGLISGGQKAAARPRAIKWVPKEKA